MLYRAAITIVTFLSTASPPGGSKMDTDILTTKIQCRDNPDCIFDNEDINIEFILTNNTGDKIGLPVKYLNQKGLHCFLVDNETGEKITLDVSLTPSLIKTQFEEIGPGESITLSRNLNAKLIGSIKGRIVNLTANATTGGVLKLHGVDEPIRFFEEAKIVIRGREKFERDKNK